MWSPALISDAGPPTAQLRRFQFRQRALQGQLPARAVVEVLSRQIRERLPVHAAGEPLQDIVSLQSFIVRVYHEVFERSRSKSSPLEKTWSKLANPAELTV